MLGDVDHQAVEGWSFAGGAVEHASALQHVFVAAEWRLDPKLDLVGRALGDRLVLDFLVPGPVVAMHDPPQDLPGGQPQQLFRRHAEEAFRVGAQILHLPRLAQPQAVDHAVDRLGEALVSRLAVGQLMLRFDKARNVAGHTAVTGKFAAVGEDRNGVGLDPRDIARGQVERQQCAFDGPTRANVVLQRAQDVRRVGLARNAAENAVPDHVGGRDAECGDAFRDESEIERCVAFPHPVRRDFGEARKTPRFGGAVRLGEAQPIGDPGKPTLQPVAEQRDKQDHEQKRNADGDFQFRHIAQFGYVSAPPIILRLLDDAAQLRDLEPRHPLGAPHRGKLRMQTLLVAGCSRAQRRDRRGMHHRGRLLSFGKSGEQAGDRRMPPGGLALECLGKRSEIGRDPLEVHSRIF